MGTVRHVVRENLLREPHLVAEQRTREYQATVAAFLEAYTPEGELVLSGEELFRRYCTSCHAAERQLVGPSVNYMVEKYEGKQEEMVGFVLNPRKVNPNLPVMPKPPIGRDEAEEIVEYILGGSE
jgi:cytochrome c551/c552